MPEMSECLHLLNPWIELDAAARDRFRTAKHPGRPNYRPRQHERFYREHGAHGLVLRLKQMGYSVIPFTDNVSHPFLVSLSLSYNQVLTLAGQAQARNSSRLLYELEDGKTLFGHEIETHGIVLPSGERRLVFVFVRFKWKNEFNENPIFATGV